MKILCFIPLCLLFAILPAVAQDAADTGWPVEERCVGEPTKPPEGWTFPGAILMTGHYGIHAVSADVPTPYVVAFIDRSQVVSGGAGLSPDQHWYAVLEGYVSYFNRDSDYREVRVAGISIYGTDETRKVFHINWDSSYSDSYSFPVMRWVDNNHLVYEKNRSNTLVLNPFDGEVTPWTNELWPLVLGWNYWQEQFFSPDWTRAVFDPVDNLSNWGVFYVDKFQVIQRFTTAPQPEFAWMLDSSHFITETVTDNTTEVTLFDRNGNQIQVLFQSPSGEQITDTYSYARLGQRTAVWSSDSRFLAFSTGRTIYVVDRQSNIVIDTCLTPTWGLAWSPDNKKLAFMPTDNIFGEVKLPLYVYDLDLNQIFIVAYHSRKLDDGVIGWRGN